MIAVQVPRARAQRLAHVFVCVVLFGKPQPQEDAPCDQEDGGCDANADAGLCAGGEAWGLVVGVGGLL